MSYRYPLRFVWQIDADGHFLVDSETFLRLIGPATIAAIGRPWQAVAVALELDPAGTVTDAISSRDTWSGIKVQWPINGSGERLEVELSGLPVFGPDHDFQGYRGFGVCRDLKRLNALAQKRIQERSQERDPVETSLTGPASFETAATGQTIVADVVAPADHASARSAASAPDEPAPLASIQQLRTPALNALERRAFRELARQLALRLNERGVSTANFATEIDDFARAPEPGTPLTRTPSPPSRRVDRPAKDQWREPRPPIVPQAHVTTLPAEPALPMLPALDRAPQDRHQRQILDRVPFGILVYRHNDLVYANQAFLTATGYETLDALAEAGGIDSLIVEPQPRLANDDLGQRLKITSEQSGAVPAEGRLSSISWDGEPANLLVLLPPVASGTASPADMTMRSAEAEARELHAILDTATDGVVVMDGEGRILRPIAAPKRCSATRATSSAGAC